MRSPQNELKKLRGELRRHIIGTQRGETADTELMTLNYSPWDDGQAHDLVDRINSAMSAAGLESGFSVHKTTAVDVTISGTYSAMNQLFDSPKKRSLFDDKRLDAPPGIGSRR